MHLGNFRLEFENTNVLFEVSSLEFFSNFHAKAKIRTFRTKIALFGYFWSGIWKVKHWCIWNQHPQFIPKAEFPAKIKILKFRTNNTYLGKFELKLKKKLLSYLKSAPSNSSNRKLWYKNKNSLIWNHNALLGYFGLKFWKSCCRIWNQDPQICLTAMFGTKIKFFWVWGPKMFDLGSSGLEFENTIVIIEISAFKLV